MSPSHWIQSAAAPRSSEEGRNAAFPPGGTTSHSSLDVASHEEEPLTAPPQICVVIQGPHSYRHDRSSTSLDAVDGRPSTMEGAAHGAHEPSAPRPPRAPSESSATPSGHRQLEQHQIQLQQQHHARLVKHKRRYCRAPGCRSIVKSQGLCQRHGAKPRKCRVETCTKQAQGNFDGMCKVHYKSSRGSTAMAAAGTICHAASPAGHQNSEAGESATYSSMDGIAAAHRWDANSNACRGAAAAAIDQSYVVTDTGSQAGSPPLSTSSVAAEPLSVYDDILPASVAWRKVGESRRGGDSDQSYGNTSDVMPLVEFLSRSGSRWSRGWHRRQERRARGCPLVSGDSVPLDDWERELIWTELLLLTGAAADRRSDAVMDHLAHAWGCPRGFHTSFMSQWIGERQSARSRDDDDAEPYNEATASEGEDDVVDIDENVEDDAGYYIDEDHDADINLSETGAATPVIGADAWDDACYTAHSYNEELASELLLDHMANSSPQHTPSTARDGLLHMMDRHRREDYGSDDDQNRVTDDASCSSREGAHRAQVSDE